MSMPLIACRAFRPESAPAKPLPMQSSGDPFPTTHWSKILRAGNESSLSGQALNELCGRYWKPIYAFIRHRSQSDHDAEDLTQSYFASLFKRSYLPLADPQRGKFRAFLIHDLKWFLSSSAEKESAEKRGGKIMFLPFLEQPESSQAFNTPPNGQVEDAFFDRHWAKEIVRLARQSVEQEYSSDGRRIVFNTLEPGLITPPDPQTSLLWQKQLNMTEGNLRVALHRLRLRYREALKKQVLETVASPEDLQDEMRHLRAALTKIQ